MTLLMYTPDEEASLTQAIPRLMREAELAKRLYVAPTVHQRVAVLDNILDYVAQRGRKVYGGFALNAVLLEVSPADAIYADNAAAALVPDVEFYSPDPVSDVVHLCDRLHAAGHRRVQGREAAHSGTFTVTVEFTRVCDITHVPPVVYDAVPTRPVTHHGLYRPLVLRAVEPSFALIDLLRLLCDPFTSHWKLDRMLPRLLLVQRLFPIDGAGDGAGADKGDGAGAGDGADADKGKGRGRGGVGRGGGGRGAPASRSNPELALAHSAALEAAVAWAAARGSCASIAEHACRFYTACAPPPSPPLPPAEEEPRQQLTLVSCDHRNDLESLLGVVDAALATATAAAAAPVTVTVTVQEFYPILDVVGARVVVRVAVHGVGSVIVATLIGSLGKAVPVAGRADDGVLVAGFAYVLMTSLALSALQRGTKHAAATHRRVVRDLLAARARARDAAGAGAGAGAGAPPSPVLDVASPFRDVGLSYIGQPVTDMSVHMDAADARRARGSGARMPSADVWFTYDPSRNSNVRQQPQQPQQPHTHTQKQQGRRGGRRGGKGAAASASAGGAGDSWNDRGSRGYVMARCDGCEVPDSDCTLAKHHVTQLAFFAVRKGTGTGAGTATTGGASGTATTATGSPPAAAAAGSPTTIES
jgi:hypothetical protein